MLRVHTLKGVGLWRHENGWKSEQRTLRECGLFWAPYIPMMIIDDDFRPRRNIVSRYATRVVNNRFYGTIR